MGIKKVYPPLEDTFSTSVSPLGKKKLWKVLKPFADLEEVGRVNASVSFGGIGMT
jgi:hypothetical protein